MPRKLRIFLIRHAESEANRDLKMNLRKPDSAIELTEEGHEQAQKAGEFLRDYIKNEIIIPNNNIVPAFRLWTSPYTRTRQTSKGIINQIGMQSEGGILRDCREKDCLRELDFGRFEGLTKEECAIKYPDHCERYTRAKEWKGQYWAKMPEGESRALVSQRLVPFIGTIIRDTYSNEERPEEIRNIIVVTHGVTHRCFTKEYTHKKWEWVDKEPNPDNCAIRLLENGENKGYIFDGFPVN